jgi:hypothetical protein
MHAVELFTLRVPPEIGAPSGALRARFVADFIRLASLVLRRHWHSYCPAMRTTIVSIFSIVTLICVAPLGVLVLTKFDIRKSAKE